MSTRLTLNEARAAGATKYYGLACRKHPEHDGHRFTASRSCCECERVKSAEHRQRQTPEEAARLKAYKTAWRLANAEAEKARNEARKSDPKVRAAYLDRQRKYWALKRDKGREAERNRKRRADPEYAAAQVVRKRQWREANRDSHLATCRAYDRKQMQENLQRRVSKNLRHRLRKALLGETTGRSAVRDLGCSIEELRMYLSSMFQPGMTWDNYGKGGWHIDHIRPLVAFDLSDPAQVATAIHYTNLQPLWAVENQKKGARHPETWPARWLAAAAAVP